MKLMIRSLHRYWKSPTLGAETPLFFFVQLSMEVNLWPEDGIQPERIESGVNKVLNIVCERRCKEKNLKLFPQRRFLLHYRPYKSDLGFQTRFDS